MIEIKTEKITNAGLPIIIKKPFGDKSQTNVRIWVANDATNCKLSYIHGAGSLYGVKKENLKEIFDAVLKEAKGCVILNTTSLYVFEFIKETYPVYYQHNVPIGYGNGFQYHVCFKNTVQINHNCRQPVQPKKDLDKEVIKQQLKALLKAKRRKADYVDEFINSL